MSGLRGFEAMTPNGHPQITQITQILYCSASLRLARLGPAGRSNDSIVRSGAEERRPVSCEGAATPTTFVKRKKNANLRNLCHLWMTVYVIHRNPRNPTL